MLQSSLSSRLLATVFIGVVGAVGSAQTSPFTVTSSADSFTAIPTYISGTTWDLAIAVTHSGSSADLRIEVTSAATLNELSIGITKSSTPVPVVHLELEGPSSPSGQTFNLVDLNSLELGPNKQGDLIIDILRVAGDLGEVECHGIDNGRVLGDVSGPIRLQVQQANSFWPVSINTLIVEGDLLGDIAGAEDTKQLVSLQVFGDIGTPSAPVTLAFGINGTIGTITCDNLYADINVGNSLRRIETTGVFVGDLWTTNLTDSAGAGTGNSGLFIGAGDLDGSVFVFFEIDGDMDIAGGLTSGSEIDITGIPEGRAISFGGDVEGTLPAFAFLDGTLEIGGNLASGIEVLDDLTGTIDIGGGTTESISIVGDLTSTASIEIGGFVDASISVDNVAGTITLQDTLNADLFIDGNLSGSVVIGGDNTKGAIAVSGDLTSSGLIQIDGVMNSAIRISGSAIGDIEIGVLDGYQVSIGDDLEGDILIDSTAGLESQIVINANDNGGEWLGDVIVGTTVLGPGASVPYLSPYYEELSTNLGGGAVGLVPFMYHAVESLPVHGSTVSSAPTSITIEHYGPIAEGDTEDEEPPVRIYELALQVPFPNTVPDPATTEVCDSHCTDVTFDENDDPNYTISVSGRVVTISGTFASWKAYQVIPTDLVCDIDGEPGIVYTQGWEGSNGCGGTESYGYGFRIQPGFDMNMNGSLEGGDIETWLATPADLDGDDDADNIDLILLVDAVTNGVE